MSPLSLPRIVGRDGIVATLMPDLDARLNARRSSTVPG
jgi:hypothetical protein